MAGFQVTLRGRIWVTAEDIPKQWFETHRYTISQPMV
jgi:hypothetical protein